jgi:ClpP class serine protease
MLFNTPLLIEPTAAETIKDVLNQRLYGIEPVRLDYSAMQAAHFDDDREPAPQFADGKLYEQVGPVAILQVLGETVQRKGGMDALSGLTSYEAITKQHRAAMNDATVKAIFTIYDSPGGAVPGLKVASDEMASGNARSGGKPHMAYIDERCYSAAYWLASCSDWIVAPDHGMGGSIGACLMMLDQSKALADEGLKPIMLRSHDRKNRGNGLEPIDDETVAKMQSVVNRMGNEFCAFVGAQRGIPADMVAETKADIFMADELLGLGLIDQIGTKEQAFEALLRAIG